MILRKPYAFFIKMFKPIHLLLAILVSILIYFENNMLSFLNKYMSSNINIVGENVQDSLVSNYLYIIPIVIIIFSLIIFSIMFKKKKPYIFYLINIFIFIVVIVINSYAINFFDILNESIVSVKSVKLIHDLILINMIIESISFLFFSIRGVGLDFRKFNFNSDLSQIEINDSDNEEFEVSVDIDLNEAKRKRKNAFRNLKYVYYERKFLINLIAIISIVVIGLVTILVVFVGDKKNVEGVIYNVNSFSIGVDSTYILNTDYRGNKVTDNYLIVVNARIKSNYSDKSLYLNDFSLKVGDAIFKPIKEYSNSVYDLGVLYKEEVLESEYNNYLFVYEVSEKFIDSEMLFKYSNDIQIKLNPKEIVNKNLSVTKNINEEISFKDILSDIGFKINSYEIRDKFLIQYNYCIKEGDCVTSKEYLKASIDENFDKYILKLNVEYLNNSTLKLNDFYDFFAKFGNISYKIDNTWYLQSSKFEEIKSSKLSENNIVYIGVDSKIMNSSNIKLVFNVRGSRYEYILK